MIISKVAKGKGKNYIEYKNKPYLLYGVQIRMDEAAEISKNYNDLEMNFLKASEIGFRSVMLPLRWREFEREDGVFDYEMLDNYFLWANKYNLTIHLLWFGSNVCGKQKSIPAFILEDAVTYKRFENSDFIDLSNDVLLEREKAALIRVMQRIFEKDTEQRTAILQIENEPDYASGWQNQYREALRYIDELGKLVKNSDYSVVTRVNITAADTLKTNHVPEDILALEGIDAVGTDIYFNDINFHNEWIKKLSTGEMIDNIVHISEGGGQIQKLLKIIANSFSLGCGYLVYELRTVRKNDYDFGVLRCSTENWEYRDGTKLVQHQWTADDFIPENNTGNIIKFNEAVNSLSEVIATSSIGDIVVLEPNEEYITENGKIEFKTEETDSDSFGLLLKLSQDTFSFFTLAKKSELHYNAGSIYVGDQRKDVNGFLSLEQGVVYKINNY